MENLIILSIIIFSVYTISVVIKYGWLPSISESFYRLPKKWNFIFTFFCWGFSIPLMIVGLDQTGNVLMFLAPAGIAFVGAAAAFKGDKMTHDVHMTGASLGVIFSHLAIWLAYKEYLIGIAAFSLMMILILLTWMKFKVNYFFWIEVIAYVSIVLCLILY